MTVPTPLQQATVSSMSAPIADLSYFIGGGASDNHSAIFTETGGILTQRFPAAQIYWTRAKLR